MFSLFFLIFMCFDNYSNCHYSKFWYFYYVPKRSFQSLMTKENPFLTEVLLFRTNIWYLRTKLQWLHEGKKIYIYLKKEPRQAILLQTQEKEEPQFRIWRFQENMKYILKIKGKKFSILFCLLATGKKIDSPYLSEEEEELKSSPCLRLWMLNN